MTEPAEPRVREPLHDYWIGVGDDLTRNPASACWRAYCDTINRAWLESVARHLRGAAVLLTDLFDEAAGSGQSGFLLDHWDRVYGVDVSRMTAGLAHRAKPHLRALSADVRRLPFADAAFDAVISLSTLDHFPEKAGIAEALRELGRVLKPGGELFLTLDNRSSPAIALRNFLPWSWLRRAGLVPYYVGATLRYGEVPGMLEAAGFQVQSTGALMHSPRVAVHLVARLLDSLTGGSMSKRLLSAFLKMELLGRLPTARWSGLYVTAHAVRTGPPPA